MKLLVKIFGTLISLGAGWLGAKLVSGVWHKAIGEEPPSLANPEKQQQAAVGKVLAFAVISGASASAIQAMAKRWTRSLEAKAANR
ncbi:DUF4235 domain-containing protein [Glutamicibacter sp.]|uniref:DUF4235 domain-containing protein n=2 Tax=Glutamicibacter sp. TaxID=1931995 RepID=UPI002FC98112